MWEGDFFFFFNLILTQGYILIFRKRGRDREDQLPPVCMWKGDQTCNLAMCSDWELNLQPFVYGTTLQPTELPSQGWLLKQYLVVCMLGIDTDLQEVTPLSTLIYKLEVQDLV